ncbi:MAG: hypothetical protein HYS13_13370 [Planctomycetia bacterium]|nr:hypothetical protein [Planctomycetia bacterium]
MALLDRSEERHAHCVDVVPSVEAPLITCEAVIAEACYLLRAMPGAASVVLENVHRGARLPHLSLGEEPSVRPVAG